MAFGLTEQEIQAYRTAFSGFDKNNDGYIATTEFGAMMERAGQKKSEEEIQKMIQGLDSNGNGKIDFNEFVTWLEMAKRAEAIAVFKTYDKDGNGFLSPEELRQGFAKAGINLTPEEADAMIKKADTNGDGRINYIEFADNMYKK